MSEQEQLDEMNAEILALQQNRLEWIKNNFMHFAKFKVGDRIYAEVAANDYKLQYAGTVTSVYIKPELADEQVKVYYKFNPDSRYPYGSDTESRWAHYSDHARYERETRYKIEQLQRALAKT